MSEVDRYLDEMFDRLARTGAAGRRTLAETEEHIRDAVADGMANGLSPTQAEHEAVTRFGAPAVIVAQVRRADRGARLRSAFSGAWLLAGLGLVALGVSYLLSALGIAILLRMHPENVPTCPDTAAGIFNGDCSESVPIMQGTVVVGVLVLLVGVTALLTRRLAKRFAGLAPVARRFPVVATSLFALAALALFIGPPIFGWPGVAETLGVQQGPGLRVSVIACGVAALAAIATASWGFVQTRRSGDLRRS